VKGLAQLGATLGREFSYELLQAVAPWDEETLRRGLQQLVEAEFLYQQGLPPQATYLFKHALIQEAAYQSLLRSMRQQYHQRIAQVLEARFPDIRETQPELLAHHYTESGLLAQAIPYWQQAGQPALRRSANVEAIEHLTRGLDILKTLPDTSEHAQRKLDLQVAIGPALMATKGLAAPEVEYAYTRARELCPRTVSSGGRDTAAFFSADGTVYVLSAAGGVPDGMPGGRAVSRPGPARRCARPPPRGPLCLGDPFVLPRRVGSVPIPPRAG
jgi:predicted ATPase